MTKLRASWAGQNKHIKANFIFKMFLSTPTHVKKTKYMVMISMMPSTLIVKFRVPGSGVHDQALVQDDNGLIVKMYQIFYSTPI